MATADPQALPDAVAEHEAGVEHRHHRAFPGHQVTVDPDQHLGIAGVVCMVMGSVGHVAEPRTGPALEWSAPSNSGDPSQMVTASALTRRRWSP